ncbi:STAS domain-containing protein [Actinoplanes sp. NPDC051513]|uniref:STAS domain-containing protein n=1 Tax=Actinoplanes sp. NPDC051513 TaxID=3363908 RepID=UPI0037956975
MTTARVREEVDMATVRLRGEVDLATAAALEGALVRTIDPGADLVVDVGELTFIDAAGLHALARVDERMREHDRRLRLERASPQLLRILAVMGLGELAA